MKTKNFRITYRDWKILRKLIPGMRGETIANYMERVVNALAYYNSK